MTIQIKNINTELLSYKAKLQKRISFSKKMKQKYDTAVADFTNAYYSIDRFAQIRENISEIKMTGYEMMAKAADVIEKQARKREIMKATNLPSENIAMSEDELISLRKKLKHVRIYGSDFSYNAGIQKECLTSIEVIFGDANLQALTDFTCLSALKSIYGNLNLPQSNDSMVDLTGLNLQVVNGDIHAEGVKSTVGLENLISVSGTIFFQDKAYNLTEFQTFISQNNKERQL